MKEEELMRKLENVKLPRIELQSHRRRLRMALLDAGYFQKQRGVTTLELAKFKVRGGIDTMLRGLVSRQPVWKTALASVLAIALIIGLTITLSSLTGQSAEALATDIAQNSPQVQGALGGVEVQVVNVIKVINDKGTVICRGEAGFVTVEVDLKTEQVIEVIPMPEFTTADEQEAMNIAKADPRVQELLDKGAMIGQVSLMYSFGVRTNMETGETEEFSEELVRVEIILGETTWIAHIDLAEGRVVRLIEIPIPDPRGSTK